jgi:hypothetical protein
MRMADENLNEAIKAPKETAFSYQELLVIT